MNELRLSGLGCTPPQQTQTQREEARANRPSLPTQTQKSRSSRLKGFLSTLLPRAFPLLFAAIAITSEPTQAAERVTLRVGPLEQTVEVSDLEHFAQTGELRSSLRFYRPLLTPQVQELLSKSFQIDPNVADTFLDELLAKPDGEQLLEQLKRAIPESSIEQLKAALYLTLHQANGLNVLSFLRAYPQDTITIDATAAVGIILQLNSSNLQSQILSPVLERELQSSSPDGLSLPSSRLDPRLTGEQKVRQRSLRLYDEQRDRSISVDLYYSRESRGPLIVLSHGFAADRNFLNYLAQHLASHGLSVATLEHPGSNIENLSELRFDLSPNDFIAASEFADRPKDISFLLDELERLNDDWGYLKGKFNTQEAVIIGHSLGGYTALALAGGELDLKALRSFCQDLSPLGRSPADWLQCAATKLPESTLRFRDERVVGAIALNPVVGQLFGKKGLAQVETPSLIFSSSEDAITPSLDHQLRPFQQLGGEKYLATVIGATHMSATDIRNLDSMVGQSTLVRELMGTEAEPVRELLRGVSLAFISQLTPQAELYRPFLTPTYVQSLSTTTLSMRLTTELPSTLDVWLQVLRVSSQKIAYQRLTEHQEQKPRSLFRANTADRCLFNAGAVIPSLRPCKGQLHHIFTSLLSNYPA